MSDLVTTLAAALLLLGLSTACWAGVGGGRRLLRILRPPPSSPHRVSERDVAVLMAAHNEEAVIDTTLAAVEQLVPPEQVFVVSDASSDRTVDLVRARGARVLDLQVGRGKAGALVAGLEEFALTRRFEVVMILDADTLPAADYLTTGLPLFDDPEVAAVAGRASTRWSTSSRGWVSRVLIAHRERVYVLFQTLLKYGQAAARANAVAIVPGFASMYRTDVLERLDIAAPGLAIEDYNMTFEIHAKGLGRVAFDPTAARAMTQDPDTLGDYVRQVGRWNLGFWQTLRRHRPRRSLFWAAVSLFAAEVVLSSLLVVVLAASTAALAVVTTVRIAAGEPWSWEMSPGGLPVAAALIGVVVVDLVATIYVAVLVRRPGMLILAPAFTLVRVLDAVLCLRALAHAVTRHSSGVWSSPTRRAETVGQAASSPNNAIS
ncbi:glycosyltransferase family 2 protein [Aeromicrobium phragmitis]|uniref:Glycosyltransferase family 2 protein n=1 Tax=Aeromicrobium phragmitis TaxID=2478914 RepID=A0A3L8PJZ6_9ACTN|nr:glycosyltransferase family 2 protein [Aeromicrobium phragmitis]RLV55685.1 glycosyltransferase family 2 protein [Aeromicrobium phragmitis]